MNKFHNAIVKSFNNYFGVYPETICGYYTIVLSLYASLLAVGCYIYGMIQLFSIPNFRITFTLFQTRENPRSDISSLNFFEQLAFFITDNLIMLFMIILTIIIGFSFMYFMKNILPEYLSKVKAKYCRQLTQDEISKIS